MENVPSSFTKRLTIIKTHSVIIFFLPNVMHYTMSIHSCIGSCSYAFRLSLTPPSGCLNPITIPSHSVIIGTTSAVGVTMLYTATSGADSPPTPETSCKATHSCRGCSRWFCGDSDEWEDKYACACTCSRRHC
jgi:hypothetical protein